VMYELLVYNGKIKCLCWRAAKFFFFFKKALHNLFYVLWCLCKGFFLTAIQKVLLLKTGTFGLEYRVRKWRNWWMGGGDGQEWGHQPGFQDLSQNSLGVLFFLFISPTPENPKN